jgi:predicted transcriptional regulator
MDNQQGNFIIRFWYIRLNYISFSMKDKIKILRENGLSINKIARECNLANYIVRDVLLEIGMPPKFVNKGAGRRRKYKVNDEFFKVIDSENKAYILGLLFADGCVHSRKNQVSITLKKSDASILFDMQSVMESDYPIVYSQSRYSSEYRLTEKARLSITSSYIISDLLRLGCVERKSDILTFPEIREDLVHHFLRGYFDGDGTVYNTKTGNYLRFGIISTLEFCTGYLNYLPVTKVNIKKENRTSKNVYYFTIARQKELENLYDYLYSNSSICLERKFNVFQKHFNRRPSSTIIEKPRKRVMV